MSVMFASVAFLLAAICAALMGYAIQRGATCTVAAVAELVEQRSARRLAALAEAALWVAGGLAIAVLLGLIPALPRSFAVSGWTVAGGMLLGFGAYANGACVFGAIARLGSGDWAYVLTPLGFFAGAVSVGPLFGAAMPVPVAVAAMHPPLWLVPPFALFAAWRIIGLALHGRNFTAKVWAPHEATILIGITFTIMFVSVGAWTYTDLLMKLAHGMGGQFGWQLGLLAALFGGAILGGWSAGRLSSRLPTMTGLARCFAGGLLMGWGSALIPGGNDGLILTGLPLLRPFAWLAILTMAATIAIALLTERKLRRG